MTRSCRLQPAPGRNACMRPAGRRQAAGRHRPGARAGAAGSASCRAICISRPADPAGDTGLLAIPAAFAAPPRRQRSACASFVPARRRAPEQRPRKSAQDPSLYLLARGTAQKRRRVCVGRQPEVVVLPKQGVAPKERLPPTLHWQGRSLSGPAQVTPAPAGGAPRSRHGASCCERWPIDPSGQLPSAPARPG